MPKTKENNKVAVPVTVVASSRLIAVIVPKAVSIHSIYPETPSAVSTILSSTPVAASIA